MFQSFHVKLSKNRSIMNKKASLTNNLQSSSIHNKNDEPTNESNQQSSPDKGKTKITPMSKAPLMGIF